MATDDFFRARLDQMIDLRHPLAVVATRMPWDEIEKALAPAFAHKDRAGRVVEGADLFGTTLQLAGAGVSNRGRPRLPIRLMVALLYLKHAFDVSDEKLVERWTENVVWQFFSGMQYYTPKLLCDATLISPPYPRTRPIRNVTLLPGRLIGVPQRPDAAGILGVSAFSTTSADAPR
jgi:IS5 family transposase